MKPNIHIEARILGAISVNVIQFRLMQGRAWAWHANTIGEANGRGWIGLTVRLHAVVFYACCNNGADCITKSCTRFIVLLIYLLLLLLLLSRWTRRHQDVSIRIICSRRDTSIAVVQENITAFNGASSISFLVCQEHIAIDNCAECYPPLAGVYKDVSTRDGSKRGVAEVVVKEHIVTADRSGCSVAIGVLDEHRHILCKRRPAKQKQSYQKTQNLGFQVAIDISYFHGHDYNLCLEKRASVGGSPLNSRGGWVLDQQTLRAADYSP